VGFALHFYNSSIINKKLSLKMKTRILEKSVVGEMKLSYQKIKPSKVA
jgi:hypothetical protein